MFLNTYEAEVIDRINMDIAARRGELTNLIAKRQNDSLKSETEIERLQGLAASMQESLEILGQMHPSSRGQCS